MATRTSWETNGLCEFILATFPILFRGIYIYIYIYGSGGGVQLRRHIALERREEGREFVFTRESRATSEKCIDQNEPGCRDIAYPPVRIDSVPSADKSCQPNSTL